MSYKIYSIESRKGGVGKTTVALNLAKALLKKGPVLLIDCDITGTSAAGAVNTSPFWKDKTNVLSYSLNKEELKELNLIEFFLEHHVKGEGNVQSFIREEGVLTNKINVISSSLYGTPQNEAINTGRLLDDLYSYWFVELIRLIVNTFDGLFGDEEKHIIIDNSPGCSRFGLALHDYMFEEGPSVSKFLFVSSLDVQDIQACLSSIEMISASFDDRTKVTQCYLSLVQAEERKARGEKVAAADLQIDKGIRELIESKDDIKEFFLHLADQPDIQKLYSGSAFNNRNSIAILLNKVPQYIEDDGIDVDFEDMLGKQKYELFNTVSGTKGDASPNIVYYDESIVYQYYINYLSQGAFASRTRNLNNRLRSIKLRAAAAALHSPMEAMEKLEVCFNALQTSLGLYNFSRISKQFRAQWSPSFAYNDLKSDLIVLAGKGVLAVPGTNKKEVKTELYKWDTGLINEISSSAKNITPKEMHCLSGMVDALAKQFRYDDDITPPIFLAILSVVLYCFKNELLAVDNQEKPFKDFVLEEFRTYSSKRSLPWVLGAEKEVEVNPSLRVGVALIKEKYPKTFSRLYARFCYALVRMIDQQEDFNAVLLAVSRYVSSMKPISLPPELIKYISRVVHTKEETFSEKTLAEICANSYAMENMQALLRDTILKNWR